MKRHVGQKWFGRKCYLDRSTRPKLVWAVNETVIAKRLLSGVIPRKVNTSKESAELNFRALRTRQYITAPTTGRSVVKVKNTKKVLACTVPQRRLALALDEQCQVKTSSLEQKTRLFVQRDILLEWGRSSEYGGGLRVF